MEGQSEGCGWDVTQGRGDKRGDPLCWKARRASPEVCELGVDRSSHLLIDDRPKSIPRQKWASPAVIVGSGRSTASESAPNAVVDCSAAKTKSIRHSSALMWHKDG